jgi:hypothetical protein
VGDARGDTVRNDQPAIHSNFSHGEASKINTALGVSGRNV